MEALIRTTADLLLRRHLTLALAESSTGGAIANALTSIPGASGFFLGGVVAYSNPSKERLLDVPAAVIETHGAVSAETSEAMALGARLRFESDLALAVTGILGPGGGSAAKPMGLTYIALAADDGVQVERFVFRGGRAANKRSSVEAALKMLVSRLEG